MDKKYLAAIIYETLDWAKTYIGVLIKANAKYSTGAHEKSMKVKTLTNKEDQTIEGALITTMPWFEHLEKGRGPFTGWTGRTGFARAMAEWNKHTGLPKAFTTDAERMGWARGYAKRINKKGDALFRKKRSRPDIYSGVVQEAYKRLYSRLNVGDAFALDFGAILRKLTFGKPINIL